MTRWRGLKDLLADAVHHGATGVEAVHRRTAQTTIEVVARVPGLGGPARAVGAVQDAAIAATYEAIRRVNGAVSAVVGLVLDAAEHPRIDAASGLRGPSHSRSNGGEEP
jgi:hypothetical protein